MLLIPIEVRMIASVLMSLAIMKVGWNLRTKNRDYSLVMQGGGIGLLVLITFISFKVYALISAPLALIVLVGFVSATAYLAVIQDSVNLALFGLVGGFMAPIMVSTGEGNHLVLFSYYTILNLAIVYISWKKAWRSLTLAGFFFTFAISGIWGAPNS